jgi:hypothetical protein
MPDPNHPRYRAIIVFTDGVFHVDVQASSPDRALGLALVDARIGHENAIYSGTMLAASVQPIAGMCVLRIEAFCVDAEFEDQIARDYGVIITEREKAPYEWAFVGRREQLARMMVECWGDPDMPDLDEMIKEIP